MLANKHRLRMLRELMRHPDQTVSQVSRNLAIPLSVASSYLRALNARGLLHPARSGRYVFYRAAPDPSVAGAAALLSALQQALATESRALHKTFRLLTGFTHPRRLMILKALPSGGLTKEQLRIATGISRYALNRHVSKLLSRGLLVIRHGKYGCARPGTRLARILLMLARR